MTTVPIESIISEGNVRFNDNNVESLAKSIDRFGLLQPLNVAKRGDEYLLVAGHRRLAALKSLGEQEVEVTFNTFVEQDADRIAMQYTENVQRKDLSAYEKAQATLDLKKAGLNQKQIADELELTSSDVSKMQKAAKVVGALPNQKDATLLTAAALFELADMASDDKLAEASLVAENALRAIVSGEVGSVSRAFGQAEREARSAAALERLMPLLDELAAAGITVVAERPDGSASAIGKHQANGLMVWGDLPTSQDWILNHRKLPCHAVWLADQYQGPELTEYCLKPLTHKGKGKSELKEASADAKQERAEADRAARKKDKEAKDLRLTNVASFVTGAWKQADILAQTPEALPLSADERRVMCRALGLEKITSSYGNYPDYETMLKGWLEAQPAKKQLLFPIVAAMAYRYVEAGWSGIKFQEVFEK